MEEGIGTVESGGRGLGTGGRGLASRTSGKENKGRFVKKRVQIASHRVAESTRQIKKVDYVIGQITF